MGAAEQAGVSAGGGPRPLPPPPRPSPFGLFYWWLSGEGHWRAPHDFAKDCCVGTGFRSYICMSTRNVVDGRMNEHKAYKCSQRHEGAPPISIWERFELTENSIASGKEGAPNR